MAIITTKRHNLKFYLVAGFATIFFCLMAIFMSSMLLNELLSGLLGPNSIFLVLFILALIFMALYTPVMYFKNSPIISIDEEQIRFGDRVFYLKDIDNVRLTGKMPFRYIIKYPMEGASIVFKDGVTKYIYDDMYTNAWQLKSFIEQVVLNKQRYEGSHITSFERNSINYENARVFKGHQFTSSWGIILWVFIGFFVFISIKENKPSTWLFLMAYSIFWFVLNSWFMHFFKLDHNFLIIKNHNFFWKQHSYNFDDVKEVVFETRPKWPNCVRVITKDFRSKLYPAGTLRDNTWRELKAALEEKGIVVRNECII